MNNTKQEVALHSILFGIGGIIGAGYYWLFDLAKKVNYASKRIVNEYSVEYGDWDGVYMKDVL